MKSPRQPAEQPFPGDIPVKYLAIFFGLLIIASASLSIFAQTATSSVVLGDTRIESQRDSNQSGQAEAFPLNAKTTGAVTSLTIYLDSSSTAQQLALGLYADASGHPGALLTQAGTAQPRAAAWNRIAVPAANVVQGRRYWIAVLGLGSGSIEFRDTDRGGCSSVTSAQTTLAALPASWTTGATWSTCRVSAYGSGSATTAPIVSVAVNPNSASLRVGSSQQFTASVSGATNTAVSWTASGGSISASGMYTAPMSPGSYMVTATSVANTSQSASAVVGVSATTAVAISLSPISSSLLTGGTQQFTATVTGSTNTAVTWSATGGSVSSSGLFTAPSTAGTYTVTATSSADSTKAASATVTVSAPVVAVSIAPGSASLPTGGTQQFTATVTGSSNTAVKWSATGGSVSSSGLFTAPSTGGTYTVTATSSADSTKSASATVAVSTPVAAVSIAPGSASLATGGTQQFTATVTGSSNTAVTWSATGGTISSSGLYTAPSAAGTYGVTATSVADSTKSASATVTVSAVAVSIAPGSASLPAGGTQQFTATVTGSSNTAVTWSATGGTISTSGLYTAPATAGTYTVTATSKASTSASASATVTVSAPIQHSVTLTWAASSSTVSGYNVYRGTVSGGPYTVINTALDASLSYVDDTVASGDTYYYVVTSVSSSGVESAFSSQLQVSVPTP
jgi:hypothetical protein